MAAKIPPAKGYKRIATEEAFAPPFVVDAWIKLIKDESFDEPSFKSLHGFYLLNDAPRAVEVRRRLQEVGPERIADMDAAGIDKQIVSITAPGPQIFDPDTGRRMAEDANDWLAEAVAKHPTRFAGLTAVAPQDPAHAAKEIERGAKKLGMKGVIINSHTRGEYLDDPKFWPVFEAAEAMNAPIYLHPTGPAKGMAEPMIAAGLEGAIYGFAVDTAMHALKIMTAGVFDRFPKLKLVLGHTGEAIPFWLYRLDYMHAAGVRAKRYPAMQPVKRTITEYMRENVWVTNSGVAWAPPIMFCREVLGPERVMYAMDYPYQYVLDEVTASDELPISLEEKREYFQGIAERVFNL
jgi:2,3-dihydroxybenzoate decarboxylase